jgi:basic membrane protein A
MSTRLFNVLAVILIGVLLLTACGAPATQAPATPVSAPTVAPTAVPPTVAPTAAPTEAPAAPTVAPTEAAPAPAGKLAGMKVAAVLPGPIDDQSWNTGAYNALLKLKDQGAEVAYVESVNPPDVEAALRDYASQGYNLILVQDFGAGDTIKKVAADFPKTAFGWVTGYPPLPENVAAYAAPLEQSAYLEGMLAGLLTKTNKLGFIAGADTPPIVAALGGFWAGARLVNPKAEVITAFPGWVADPVKSKEVAKAQIAAGADVIMGRGGDQFTGALEAAKEAGLYTFGDMIDMNSLAPNLIVTSSLWDLSVAWTQILEQIKNGTYKGGMFVAGMPEGATDIAPTHGLVPEDALAKVEAVRQQIKDGTFKVPVFTKVPTATEIDAAPKPALP